MRYYDLDAANARLTVVRPLLVALKNDRDVVAREQSRLNVLEASPDANQPGVIAERDQREAAVRDAVARMQACVAKLVEWDVTLRDINTGLIDFPALANGRPVWLCWRLGESDIGFWHRQDEGFAGRKPIAELPVEGAGPIS
jgi:hypothetical protein